VERSASSRRPQLTGGGRWLPARQLAQLAAAATAQLLPATEERAKQVAAQSGNHFGRKAQGPENETEPVQTRRPQLTN